MKKESPQKYDQFLDAAISLIEEKGYDNTSVSQIVKRTGLAQGTFYLYFSSKAALAPGIAERIIRDVMDRGEKQGLNHTLSFEEFLRGLIDLVFEITEEYEKIISFLYSGMSYYHSLESWETIYDPYYLWLEGMVGKYHESGEIRNSLESRTLVQFILGIIEHSAETYYLFKRKNEDVKKLKEDLLDFILAGVKESKV